MPCRSRPQLFLGVSWLEVPNLIKATGTTQSSPSSAQSMCHLLVLEDHNSMVLLARELAGTVQDIDAYDLKAGDTVL